MSELGLVHQPASMPEMGTTGQRVLLKEPPPAYYTLEHRNPPVEMHAESSHRMLPEIRSEMEAWNGFQMVSDMSPGMNSRTMLHEAPVARPVTERSTNLQVNTDVNPVIHTTDENIEEDEEEGLSRSITYSSFSLREAALGMVAMPSIVSRERKRDQGKS
jgi:hypothetical protein